MMLLDACFIINYVLTDQKLRNRNVTINGLGHLFLPLIQRDLFLLENQIPFMLLEMLISMGYGQKSGKEMLCIYFNSTLYGDYEPNGIANSIKKQPFHLLDDFRLMLVPTTPKKPNILEKIIKICTTLLENIAIFPSQWCKLRWSTTRKHQEEVGFIAVSAPRKPLSCIESLSPPDVHLVEEEHMSCIESLSPPDKNLVEVKHWLKSAPTMPLSCIESLSPCIESLSPPDVHLVEEEHMSCIESLSPPDKHLVEEEHWLRSAPTKPLSCIESLPPPDKHHDKKKKYTAKKWVHSFRSASELKSRGIHFRPSKENSLMSIKFHPGTFFATLELPVWFVSMDNKVFFLNMIAYELCPGACTDQVVTAYIELMKKLIDNPKDVKELREQEILLITSGNDEDVVKVYKELNTYGIDSVEVFQKTKNDIQHHYCSKGKTWLAELIYVYFRTPWTVITLLAATVLLILTFLQTYLYHPSKIGKRYRQCHYWYRQG